MFRLRYKILNAALIICIVLYHFPISATPLIQLSYPPEIPVQHICKMTIDLQESFPYLNLSSRGQQLIKYDLVGVHDDNQIAKIKNSTHNFTFTLRDIFVDLSINQENSIFDPRVEHPTIPLMQFARLIDKPMSLQVAPHKINIDERDLARLIKEIPSLQSYPLKEFLFSLLITPFAMLGNQIEIGKSFKIDNPSHTNDLYPAFLTYHITSIKDKTIEASISGTTPSSTIYLDAPATSDETNPEKVGINVVGKLSGTIAWDRTNALFYTMKTEYHCDAVLAQGNKQWNMQLKLTNQISSTAAPTH